MKIRILVITYICLIFIMLNLLFINVENTFIINKYENGEYLEKNSKLLTNITFQKSYISNYNYGNILYQNGEYENAIEEYKKALKTVISQEKECKIRINCALAMCKNLQVDETDQESISNAIIVYQDAISILTEKDCVNHNQDAKNLKTDIEKEIERLKKLQKNTYYKDDEKEDKKEQKNEENIKDKIQNIKEEAIKEDKEVESVYKNFNNRDYSNKGKNW